MKEKYIRKFANTEEIIFRELVVCKGAIRKCILKNPCNLFFRSKFSVKKADFVAQLYNFCNFADGKKN